MANELFLIAVIIIICVLGNKFSSKIGMPMLFAFICLGMLFGSDGIVKIYFDNFIFTEQVCSVALIFIMFYGGFGTKWSEAKPVAIKGIILSSLGTLLTAVIVCLFCYLILKINFLESFLIGSVISSTDAASVFSILRSKRLSLKDNTASLLEIESGSNDPFSFMLTIIALSMMNGSVSLMDSVLLVISQLFFGISLGVIIAFCTKWFLKHFKITSSGFSAIFFVGVALIAYSLPTMLNGNGFLSVYIAGIILGNSQLDNPKELVHFFDGLTGFMQMILFFLLGLLSFPSELPSVTIFALSIALFLTFVARPITVFFLLSFFKASRNQKILVSWAGMRGAASIVFAILAVINPASTNNDIFHIVFFIVLFSILLQGTLIPFVAKKVDMIDLHSDVMKTFTDYVDEVPIQFLQFKIPHNHVWINQAIKDILLPPNTIIALIIKDGCKIIPRGKTIIEEDDVLILSGLSLNEKNEINLYEKKLYNKSLWIGKTVQQLELKKEFIVLIKRDEEVIIPKGSTLLQSNDVIVLTNKETLNISE